MKTLTVSLERNGVLVPVGVLVALGAARVM